MNNKLLLKFNLNLIVFIGLIFLTTNICISQITLKKIGELKVNSLDPVKIIDFDSNSKKYLGYKNSSELIVIIIDSEGNIVSEKNLKGEGPSQFTSEISSMGFSDSGQILIQTPNELLTYDLNLEFKDRVKYGSTNPFTIYSPTNILYFKKNSDAYFVTHPTGFSWSISINDFSKSNLLEIYNVATKNSFEILKVSDRSIFNKLDNSLGQSYYPIFSYDNFNKNILFTSSFDNEISVIDVDNFKIKSTIQVNHGSFDLLDDAKITSSDLESVNRKGIYSTNLRLLKTEDYVVLEYLTEIPEHIFRAKLEESKSYKHYMDGEYHKLIFFHEGNQISRDISLPKFGKLTAVLPGNKVLFRIENPDIEEDFILFHIYQIN
ncbi:hypothetical protein [Algoriphagus aquimarinus]|uniref:6-bladed beta-propeller protein n=1 Tax=Algoriphagus aquimarinus TaxID=237018 RepID=A0A5C7AD94_9BACT|nr:hypothetical protein [Algoriphagus aquimarinus]TXE06431.1 hypothetical protein ESV85_16770 [Algoriphagus aquimarinus]